MKQFLQENDFGQYSELFEAEEITLDVLAELSHEELKDLGIKAYGHRHRLLRAAKRKLSGPQESMIQG
jgi:tankyrase